MQKKLMFANFSSTLIWLTSFTVICLGAQTCPARTASLQLNIVDTSRIHYYDVDRFVGSDSAAIMLKECFQAIAGNTSCRVLYCRDEGNCSISLKSLRAAPNFTIIRARRFTKSARMNVLAIGRHCFNKVTIFSKTPYKLIHHGYKAIITSENHEILKCISNNRYSFYSINYSSFHNWREVVKPLKLEFAQAKGNISLPSSLRSVMDSEMDARRKVLTVWQWVSEHIKYDLNRNNFAHVQKPNVTIAEKLGDCKSIDLLTQVILSHYHIRSEIIYTDGGAPFIPNTRFIGAARMNHVVLRVLGGYLVDPTVTPSIYSKLPQYKIKRMSGIEVSTGQVVSLYRFPVHETR